MQKYSLYKIITVLSVIGIFLASFLFINFLTKPAVEICTINEQFNCDAVTKGTLSTIAGIPVSLIGLIGYLAILIFSLLKNRKAVLGVAVFGMVFCLRLTFLELFSIKVVCPVCLACQLDMLIISILAFRMNFKK